MKELFKYPLLDGLASLDGMCGRLPIDYEEMIEEALAPAANGDPRHPDLIRMLNSITHTIYTAGQMQPIADLLNDPTRIQQILEQNRAVKLAFSHVPPNPSSLLL